MSTPSTKSTTKSFELAEKGWNSFVLINFSILFLVFMLDAECTLSLNLSNNLFKQQESRQNYSQQNSSYSRNRADDNNNNNSDYGNYNNEPTERSLIRNNNIDNEEYSQFNSRNYSNANWNSSNSDDIYGDARNSRSNRNYFGEEQIEDQNSLVNNRNRASSRTNSLRRTQSAPAILRQDSYRNSDRTESLYNNNNSYGENNQNSLSRIPNNYNYDRYENSGYYNSNEEYSRYNQYDCYSDVNYMQDISDAHIKFEDHRRNLIRKGLLACGRILEYLKPLMAGSNERFEIAINNRNNSYQQIGRSNAMEINRNSGIGSQRSYSNDNFSAEAEEYRRLLADSRLQKEVAIVADLAWKGQQIENEQAASENDNDLIAYAEKLSKHTKALLDMYGCLYEILHNEYPIIAARRMPWIVDV